MRSRKEMNVFEELVAGENPLGAGPGPDHGRVISDTEAHRATGRGWYPPPDAINQLVFANVCFWHAIHVYYRSRALPKRATVRQFSGDYNSTPGQLDLNSPHAQVTCGPMKFKN